MAHTIHCYACVVGMQYLHQMDYIHRDLKTANGIYTSRRYSCIRLHLP